MNIKQALTEIAKTIPVDAYEFKPYGKSGKQMATTHSVNVNVNGVPVPGQEGKLAHLQITFCANLMDISDAAKYQATQEKEAKTALDNMSEEARSALIAEYL